MGIIKPSSVILICAFFFFYPEFALGDSTPKDEQVKDAFWDLKTILAALAIIVSLGWNLYNQIRTNKVAKILREEDLEVSHFQDSIQNPFRKHLDALEDINMEITSTILILDDKERDEQLDEINLKIVTTLSALQNIAIRANKEKHISKRNDWSQPISDKEDTIFQSIDALRNSLNHSRKKNARILIEHQSDLISQYNVIFREEERKIRNMR